MADPAGVGSGSIDGTSPTADDGALIIAFPRGWIADQRLPFMGDVARAIARERWQHVAERMCTDSIAATAAERRSVFARLSARRALRADGEDVVSVLVRTA